MKFSALMCVYAGDFPKPFEGALESILRQTKLPSEIVLVADGPLTKELELIIEKYEPLFSNFKVDFCITRLKQNSGHGIARQRALEQSNEDYVVICDADDINKETRFERLMSCFVADGSLSVVGSDILEVDHETLDSLAIRKVANDHDAIVEELGKRCPFNQMSVALYKKKVFDSGGYKDFYHNEDYYLWIRMFLNGAKFKNINECLVLARVNKSFYSRRGGVKYFVSELKIQNMLHKNRIIRFPRLIYNVAIRFIVQVVLPNRLRGYLFNKLARVPAHKEGLI